MFKFRAAFVVSATVGRWSWRSLVCAFAVLLPTGYAQAKLSVLATTTDLGYIVKQVGGDGVQVDTICKGTQDPHFVEAKPSYMVKASHADLLVAVGLDLEVGYVPPILRGARNPKILPGAKGYLEVGPQVSPIEIPTGSITRAEGDVHPYGNPHFTLDPIRDGQAAVVIADRMAELDPANADKFKANASAFQKRIEAKTKDWAARIAKTGITKIVTYHKTLNYFFDRFHIENPIQLEPKPGIPPTSGHIIEVIDVIKSGHIPLILVENYFDPSVTRKIVDDVPSTRAAVVPVAVDGAPGTDSTEELIEKIVTTIEGK
jgi:zinc/manganese transport system substrate-binding protein